MEEYYLDIDLLGKMYIDEIFVYYDEPLMFSCKNRFYQLFIANCVDQNENIRKWLVLPISSHRLVKAKQGKITVFELYTQPEEEFLWEVYEDTNIGKSKANQVELDSLNHDELPMPGTYLIREDVQEHINCERDLLSISTQENRDIIDISLELNDMHEHEIAPDILGNTLCEFQKLVYSIAHKAKGINSQIPKSIIEENQLKVTDVYAASFGIRLKSNDIANLYGETKVQETLKTLMQLLHAQDDRGKIQNILSTLNPRVGFRYRSLLKALVKDNIGIKTYIATPNNYNEKVFLDTTQIVKSLQVLESEINSTDRIVEYFGELVGINVDNKTFSFKPIDEKKINGKLSDSVRDMYTVPIYLKVQLREEIKLNLFTNKEEVEYTLVDIIE